MAGAEAGAGAGAGLSGVGSPKDIGELRQRMQAKLVALKRKRQESLDGPSKRQARREKKQSQKKQGDKKQKGDKKQEKFKKNKEDPSEIKELVMANNSTKTNQDKELEVSHLQFSSIAEPKPIITSKAPKRVKGGKDAVALKKVEAFNQKIEMLKQTDAVKAEAVIHGAAVSNALMRAQGIKVHDSKKLIVKSLKRKERAKNKSKREWGRRTKETNLAKKDRAIEGKEKRKKAKNKMQARLPSKNP